MKLAENIQKKSKEELVCLVSSLQQELQNRDSAIDHLHQQLLLAKQRHYGRKSEKVPAEQEELNFFDEANIPENEQEIVTVEEEIIVATHSRKKKGRKPLPKNLPRVRKEYDLTEEQKICSCGCHLSKIGEDISEQLEIIPAKIQVIEHVKLKYACKTCQETIKTSPGPKHPIPRSIASPGLLAHVLINKFADHLPLYRQEKIIQRIGVDIARNTLALWVIKCGELLVPLYKLLQAEIINYDIAFADETRLQVLKEPGRAATSGSYMWVFIGGTPDRQSIIYRYDPGRAHTVIEQTLEDFKGYLHCDGFVGYDSYAIDHAVLQIGCWMHGRRRFAEIVKTTKSKGLAHEAINLIAKLYHLETKIKELKLGYQQIYNYRQEHAKPILTKMKKWLDKNTNKVLPKSPIGQAIKYCLNQWVKLIRYLEDGRLSIDNGLAERTVKPFVIGRKNWMFCDSVAGAKAAEVIYSIIETCKANKIEPYAYLRKVLEKIPYATTEQDLQLLLPFNIDSS